MAGRPPKGDRSRLKRKRSPVEFDKGKIGPNKKRELWPSPPKFVLDSSGDDSPQTQVGKTTKGCEVRTDREQCGAETGVCLSECHSFDLSTLFASATALDKSEAVQESEVEEVSNSESDDETDSFKRIFSDPREVSLSPKPTFPSFPEHSGNNPGHHTEALEVAKSPPPPWSCGTEAHWQAYLSNQRTGCERHCRKRQKPQAVFRYRTPAQNPFYKFCDQKTQFRRDRGKFSCENRRCVHLARKHEMAQSQQFKNLHLLQNGCCDGLAEKDFDSMGRGVETTRAFEKGEFLVEYRGKRRKKREYDRLKAERPDDDKREYVFHAMLRDQWVIIDANDESEGYGFGRLINHSREPNCEPRVSEDGRVYFVALQDIPPGTQLLYDYHEDNPIILRDPAHRFLRKN